MNRQQRWYVRVLCSMVLTMGGTTLANSEPATQVHDLRVFVDADKCPASAEKSKVFSADDGTSGIHDTVLKSLAGKSVDVLAGKLADAIEEGFYSSATTETTNMGTTLLSPSGKEDFFHLEPQCIVVISGNFGDPMSKRDLPERLSTAAATKFLDESKVVGTPILYFELVPETSHKYAFIRLVPTYLYYSGHTAAADEEEKRAIAISLALRRAESDTRALAASIFTFNDITSAGLELLTGALQNKETRWFPLSTETPFLVNVEVAVTIESPALVRTAIASTRSALSRFKNFAFEKLGL